MNCLDCLHCEGGDGPVAADKTCKNSASPNHGAVMSWDDAAKASCGGFESRVAHDYATMTAWDFAVKYYM